MFTIRQLAQLHGLSRSALLYYDKIDLLPPTTRSVSNYRLYDDRANERLANICLYRSAGIPVEEIRKIMNESKGKVSKALQKRLSTINSEIHERRQQQQRIVNILKNSKLLKKTRFMNKEHWIELLRQSGFTENDMSRWHTTFENNSPEAHQDFLESIGIPDSEVASIREYSRTGKIMEHAYEA